MNKDEKYNLKKDSSFSIRMPGETLLKLRAMEDRSSIALSTLTLALLTDLLHYEEQHGELRMPFCVIPCSELHALRVAADGQKK